MLATYRSWPRLTVITPYVPSGWTGLTTELLLDPGADAGLGVAKGAAELDRWGADTVNASAAERGDGDAQVVRQFVDGQQPFEPGVGGCGGHATQVCMGSRGNGR